MAIPYKKQYVKSDGRKLDRSGPRDMQSRVSGHGYTQTENDTSSLVNQLIELKAEIIALKSKSGDEAPAGFFSAEQVDNEIRKAVELAVIEASSSLGKIKSQATDLTPLVKEYKTRIVELQQGNDNLTKLQGGIIKENTNLKEEIDKLKQEFVDVVELKKQIAVLEQELSGKEELIETLKTRPAIVGDEIIDPERPQMEQLFVDPLEDDADEGMKSSITVDTVVKDDGEVDNKVDKLRDLLGKLPTK